MWQNYGRYVFEIFNVFNRDFFFNLKSYSLFRIN